MLYLTPDGNPPSGDSICFEKKRQLEESGHLGNISYKEDIIALLDIFEQLCKADIVRAFFRDFKKYLNLRYKGEHNMEETKFIADFVKGNTARLKTALNIISCDMAVKNEIWKLAIAELKEFARNKNLKIEIKPTVEELSEKWADICIWPNKWKNGRIVFRFERAGMRDAWIGVEKLPYALLTAAKVPLGLPEFNEDPPNIGKWTPEYNAYTLWDKILDTAPDCNRSIFAAFLIDESLRLATGIENLSGEAQWGNIEL